MHRDRRIISAKTAFKRAKRLEAQYASRLRQVARHVGDIVRGFRWDTFNASIQVQDALRRYSSLLRPWAEAVAERMVTQVAASDRRAWRTVSAQMGRALQKEIETAPTGVVMRESIARQVGLITSLPLDAAERVHKIAQEGITTGKRASDVAEDIMKTGLVTRSRADLIAQTEVSRVATELTKSRAEHIGSEFFIWRTSKDESVRHDHRILEGKSFRWNDPPIADQRTGVRALPGGIYRCRCWPQAIIPD